MVMPMFYALSASDNWKMLSLFSLLVTCNFQMKRKSSLNKVKRLHLQLYCYSNIFNLLRPIIILRCKRWKNEKVNVFNGQKQCATLLTQHISPFELDFLHRRRYTRPIWQIFSEQIKTIPFWLAKQNAGEAKPNEKKEEENRFCMQCKWALITNTSCWKMNNFQHADGMAV